MSVSFFVITSSFEVWNIPLEPVYNKGFKYHNCTDSFFWLTRIRHKSQRDYGWDPNRRRWHILSQLSIPTICGYSNLHWSPSPKRDRASVSLIQHRRPMHIGPRRNNKTRRSSSTAAFLSRNTGFTYLWLLKTIHAFCDISALVIGWAYFVFLSANKLECNLKRNKYSRLLCK